MYVKVVTFEICALDLGGFHANRFAFIRPIVRGLSSNRCCDMVLWRALGGQ
jgi:hypothetical protein